MDWVRGRTERFAYYGGWALVIVNVSSRRFWVRSMTMSHGIKISAVACFSSNVQNDHGSD
jgi:hypothetical protein